MRKTQIYTGIVAAIGMSILILDSKTALEGAAEGVDLCIRTIIPSLFPFMLLSILVSISVLGAALPWLRPLEKICRMPNGCGAILLTGVLGGYPAGAQAIALAYRTKSLAKTDAERMLAFCNNAGPAFLFGMVSRHFPNLWMVWTLWFIHIVSALLVAYLFPGIPATTVPCVKDSKRVSISDAMRTALRAMASICGWVILFRILICYFRKWVLWMLPGVIQNIIIGVLELSNGCISLSLITNIPLRFVVCSGILAFGGLCVMLQTASVTEPLSLKTYFYGKLLQSIFSLLLACAAVSKLGIFLFPAVLAVIPILQKSKNKGSIPALIDV